HACDDGSLRIELANERLRTEVSRLVAGRGWTILELREEAPSLEDVFLRIVGGATGDGPAGASAAGDAGAAR
ncbi:MAG: hypothetical protein ACKOCT_17095, partial [Alphaproteobacteria bacterium]